MTLFLIITSILGWLAFFGLLWITTMISKLYMIQKQQINLIAEHAEFLSRHLDWNKLPPPNVE